MEPRHNERPRRWQNLFAVTSFRYIEVGSFFHFFWDKENRLLAEDFVFRGSLYRGTTVSSICFFRKIVFLDLNSKNYLTVYAKEKWIRVVK